jgi:hypothetical protein
MVNILSEMTSDTGMSKEMKDKIAKQKEAPKKRE